MASKIITFILFLFIATEIAASPSHGHKKQNHEKNEHGSLFNRPVKHLMGTFLEDHRIKTFPVKKHDANLIASLPENFDPREKWTNCPSLREIRDQGCCGSCWAFGAVAAMTDRVCIHSNGTKNFYFSAEDLVSCGPDDGCNGGITSDAWVAWNEDGIVSGGPYNSNKGCLPYEIPNYKKPSPCLKFLDTPKCASKCQDSYGVEYEKDKRYGKEPYTIEGEDHIKAELFTNGPIEASFVVYQDFLNYKSGVYKRQSGDVVGGHAVKMMGWGVEDGKKYWLLANSWNTLWGENGFFKILRGENHSGIERFLVAAEPDLHDF